MKAEKQQTYARCAFCGNYFKSLGLASHRASCQRKFLAKQPGYKKLTALNPMTKQETR